jgi:hypothetical protein
VPFPPAGNTEDAETRRVATKTAVIREITDIKFSYGGYGDRIPISVVVALGPGVAHPPGFLRDRYPVTAAMGVSESREEVRR